MKNTSIIQGGIFTDHRGKIAFVNDFDMTPIKRMYHIHQSDTSIVRAWQGHQKESKWFQCIQGRIMVKAIAIHDWQQPNKHPKIEEYIISDANSQILHIPQGYVNGFKAITENAILMVYSDATLEESKNDDIRFAVDYWDTKW